MRRWSVTMAEEKRMVDEAGGSGPVRLSRRQFLMASGAAAAGAVIAPGVARARGRNLRTPGKVRMGVVGGGFGASFQWHLHPDCIVEAVSDLRPERLQHLKDVYHCDKGYPSLEELIKDPDVDAVAVFTGAPDHVRHCVMALKAGKHVICAVPAAMTIDECEELRDTVEKTGLTYMMAETSYYRQPMITARQWWKAGKFGEIYYTEAEYHHPGLDVLYTENGKKTWRYGLAPMNYPTHCTSFLVGLTGERLVEATCLGWGNDSQYLKDNVYKNPFWNETAFFKTDRGHSFRVAVYWYGALRGTERAQWYGDKMSFFHPHPNGLGPVVLRASGQTEKDDAGFQRQLPEFEQYKQVQWWNTEMLPEPLRFDSGHDGSHSFLTHEFVRALIEGRRPTVDVYEALAYTAPGIVAHQSALKGGAKLKVPAFDRV